MKIIRIIKSYSIMAVVAIAASFAMTSAAVTYSISPNPASVNENAGHLTFTITRSSSSTTATVYASTVTDQGYSNNGYYVGILNQVVSFSVGQSTAQVTVTINDLGLTSGSEVFRFIVQQNSTDPISTYLATDNFTIVNNDVVTYSISPNPASVYENAGHLTFTISRSSSTAAATVYASTVTDQGYSNNGYYVGILNQTVSFSAGQSTAQVTMTINDLGLTSGSEIFRFIVQQHSTDPTSTYLATDNFTIINNDPPPTTYSITPNPASVNENAGHLTFTITRSSSSAAATVYASTVQDQGYSNSGDYVGLVNQTVSFSAGQSTAQVTVTINDLGLTSGSKTFRIEVQRNPTDPLSTYLATDNFTILDNDPVVVTYSITPNPASVNENAGHLTFTITRSSSSAAATVYASTVQDQGYSNGGDYVGLVSQAVSFSAGQSTAQVTVTINDLGLTSGSKTFRIEVQQNPTDPIATYLATDNFTILDNDPVVVTYSITPNPASVNENAGHLTFTVTRSTTSTAATVYASTVQDQGYSNSGDYVGLVNQTVSFSAGQSTAQVTVTINDLGLTSGSKTFRIEVQQNPTDPIATYLATDNFTILDNDPVVVTYSITPNPASVNENAGHLTFTVTRSSSSAAATVYASTVQDQGYSNGGDYVGLVNQTVSFSAGQSTAQVTVTINDLGLTSGSKTFRIEVQQNPTDPLSTYLATDNFTILDNDLVAATYSITPNPASVNENAGHLTFTITRSSSSAAATVYASTVQDQGYSNNGYYVGLLNQLVSFSAGQSSAQVSVTINDLGLTSGSEIFRFIVQQNSTDPVSTYLATDNFTIINNDIGSGTGLKAGIDARNTGIVTYASQIKADGYSFVGQYIGRDSTYLTAAQAAALETVGLQVFSIYEKEGMADTDAYGNHTFAWQTYFSESQGEADARTAYIAATTFARQPFGSAIYFGIDLDPGYTSGITEADALSEIDQYFHGLQNYFNSLPSNASYAIGVYGAGDTLTQIMDGGLAKYCWLASPHSWAGFYIWDPIGATSFAWNIHQVQNYDTSPYGSIPIDTDETPGLPFGAWNDNPVQLSAQIQVVLGVNTIANGQSTPINFGSVQQGQTGPTITFVINNIGSQTLTFGTTTVLTGYTVMQNPPASLAPGGQGTFVVRLGSASVGTKVGQISIASNDPNSPFNFQVTGAVTTAATPPQIQVAGAVNAIANGQSTPVNFGSVQQGQAGPTVTFSINNVGGQNLTLGTVSIPAGYTVAQNPPASLAPGGQGTFAMQLNSDSVGSKAGQISVANNDPSNSTFTFQVIGAVTATAMPPQIQVASGSNTIANGQSAPVNFGSVQQGQTGLAITFSINNIGGQDLALGAITVPTGFIVRQNPPASLAPGGQGAFVVQLDSSSTGTNSGLISIANSDPSNAPFTFELTGIVTPPPPKQLTEMNMNTNGVFSFSLNGPVGSNYVVQVSSNLVNWVTFSFNTIPASGSVSITDLTTHAYSRRFYRAVPLATGTNIVFSDNFSGNTINSSKWTTSGNTVLQSTNTMQVLTTVTDQPGMLTSKPFVIANVGLITITRQVFLHHDDSVYYLGNNHFFTGFFTINVTNVPPFSVEYCDYDYNGGGLQPTYGFFITRNGAGATGIASQADVSPGITAIWDTWFNEKVTYDPSSGQLQYFINNTLRTTFNVGAMPVGTSPTMSLYFQAYGWWTGHEQLFQNLVVSQQTP
jgi:hypothetical protein